MAARLEIAPIVLAITVHAITVTVKLYLKHINDNANFSNFRLRLALFFYGYANTGYLEYILKGY
jgi:hypothetical protein